MNKEWSSAYREMVILLRHKSSFDSGIDKLLHLRRIIYTSGLTALENKRDDLNIIAYPASEGYESKTVIYSIYHIFRAEDIVCNILMQNKENDIFKENGYVNVLNELSSDNPSNDEIVEFSKNIDLLSFLKYIEDVYSSTNNFLLSLKYDDLKKKITNEAKEALAKLSLVHDESDNVINKTLDADYLDIIKMVFSEHWILHAHAANRILNRISAMRKVDNLFAKLDK